MPASPSAAAVVNQPARSPATQQPASAGGSSSAASQQPKHTAPTPGASTGAAAAPSLMDEAFAGLDRLGKTGSSIKPPDQVKPADDGMDEETQEQQQTTQPDEKGQETDQKEEKGQQPDQQKAQPGKPKEKVSPWKLVDHYKSTNTTLQKEIAELRTKQGEPPKEWQDKLTAAQKRAEELENHIRFVDYQKSQEFTEKYAKPYEEAWMRAISGLKGLKVQWSDPQTGEVTGRDITPQDIAALANMDPAAARQEIRQRFPEDAAEVKTYVERIRDLAYAQNKALEEHQSKGAEHWKAQAEQIQAKQRAFIESNTKLWEAINKEAVDKFDFLRPVDGDDERNAKLDGAVKFVDDALAARITDPKLTDDDRALVLRKHAALRNRAIGYSVLLHENKGLKAKLAELEQSLKAYESSSPTEGDGRGKETNADLNGEALMDSVLSGMNKYVRR